MTAADRIRAQAKRSASRQSAPEPDSGPVPAGLPSTPPLPAAGSRPARTGVPRAKTVRITLDLAPLQYRRLNRWCDEAAETLGVARVTSVSVLRQLLVQLDNDPELGERLLAQLRQDTTGPQS